MQFHRTCLLIEKKVHTEYFVFFIELELPSLWRESMDGINGVLLTLFRLLF